MLRRADENHLVVGSNERSVGELQRPAVSKNGDDFGARFRDMSLQFVGGSADHGTACFGFDGNQIGSSFSEFLHL